MVSVGTPLHYQIRAEGVLDDSWSSHFEWVSKTESVDAAGRRVTTLAGRVADQAALLGLLSGLVTLGLPVLEVECRAATGQAGGSGGRDP